MQAARQQQWQKILQMTEQLHQLSAEENWEGMSKLESERFDSLQVFFADVVSEADAKEVELGIKQILKSDSLLMQHSTDARQSMSDGLKKMSTGKQAIEAYGHFQKS